MKFQLHIQCDNAAFDGMGWSQEVGRILKILARKMEHRPVADFDPTDGGVTLFDYNGNRVGRATVSHP